MSSRIVRGKYVPGCGHSIYRPKFYETMRLHQGTINILVDSGIPENILIPATRVPGIDPIDADQEFLIRPCVLKATRGYQILPVTKSTGTLAGHHAEGKIEVALVKKIDLCLGEELEIELQEYHTN